MSTERIVRFDEVCLDRFINELEIQSFRSHPILVDEVMPNIITAFKELWPALRQPFNEESLIRAYDFRSDYVPLIVFYARLEAVSISEEKVIEQIVIYDIEIQTEPL